jgi:hypothetical protein
MQCVLQEHVQDYTLAALAKRERVLFIGTQFSNLYTLVDTSARGRVGVCVVCVCKYVLGRSRVSQPLNLRSCLLQHFGCLNWPRAIKTRSRCHLSSCRLLRCSTPTPHPIQRACSDCDISPGPGQDTGTPLARPGHTHCDVLQGARLVCPSAWQFSSAESESVCVED